MQKLHVEATCTEDGVLVLRDLPVQQGDSVEVVIFSRSSVASVTKGHPLRGEAVEYIRPFEPVAETDWETVQ